MKKLAVARRPSAKKGRYQLHAKAIVTAVRGTATKMAMSQMPQAAISAKIPPKEGSVSRFKIQDSRFKIQDSRFKPAKRPPEQGTQSKTATIGDAKEARPHVMKPKPVIRKPHVKTLLKF